MAYTVTLPEAPNAGDPVMVGPLPAGDWVAPEGWRLSGNFLVRRWRAGLDLTVTVEEIVHPPCGLCGLEIEPDDVTISRAGLLSPTSGDPDAHQACYRRAVEEKVSAPGGPASPYPDPGPSEPAWAPNLAVAVGQVYTYNGQRWRVVQAHTTQASWTPPAVPALWTLA